MRSRGPDARDATGPGPFAVALYRVALGVVVLALYFNHLTAR